MWAHRHCDERQRAETVAISRAGFASCCTACRPIAPTSPLFGRRVHRAPPPSLTAAALSPPHNSLQADRAAADAPVGFSLVAAGAGAGRPSRLACGEESGGKVSGVESGQKGGGEHYIKGGQDVEIGEKAG